MSSKFDYRKYKNYDEHVYDGPGRDRGPINERQKAGGAAYRKGWERVFGNKKGVIDEHIGGRGAVAG